jgi:iron complex transport system substrate-binding protein
MTKLSAFNPNVEALLNYKPDLIILNADATKALEVKAALEKLKIKVFLERAPKTLREAYLEITALGRATGKISAAQSVVSDMKSKISAAVKSGRTTKKISFFHELDNTLYTATSDTFIGKVYKDFNLINIADPAASADSAGYPQLQSEYVIKANPKIGAQYGGWPYPQISGCRNVLDQCLESHYPYEMPLYFPNVAKKALLYIE